MILQSLAELYERRSRLSDPADRPAPIGFEAKEIPFIIEVDAEGKLIQIADTRQLQGKRKVGRTQLVPRGVKKTSGIVANLLWDTAEYVLGCQVELKNKATKPERLREQHSAFRDRVHALLPDVEADVGVLAVLRFFERLDPAELERQPAWEDIRTGNPLLSFRLQHDQELVCQRPAVRSAWLAMLATEEADGRCLVSGEQASIERLHPAIKGVWGAQSSGANIVSFNLDAFNSYGKQQGLNAPVGSTATTQYSTALNDLLARDSRQRIQVGDASTVFWVDRDNAMQDDFLLLIGEAPKDDGKAGTDRVRLLYDSIRSGKYLSLVEGSDRFFVLGLSPNAARLAIRFWHAATVAEIAERFARWFDDLAIDHAPYQSDHLSLFRLLTACALQSKAEHVPPRLGGDILRAVLSGGPYPQGWLQAAIQRCRAEREVDYPRAAAIKACLNRRAHPEEKLTVSLDPESTNVPYRLGRLFAVLERIQEEASPGLNATIRDRYFGAASSNPQTVFPTLNRLKNHHLGKLESRGRAVNLERLVGEIVDGLPAAQPFPAQLSLADQGRFAVGYYHQRQHASTYKSTHSTETAP